MAMTPINKPPLPPSQSLANYFLYQPTNYTEWQIAIKQVQVYYERHQYRECAAHCETLLLDIIVPPHPAQVSAIHFYAALSNDESARSLHHLSITKLPLLHSAKEHYLEARDTLPDPDTSTPSHHGSFSSFNSDFSRSNFMASIPETPTPMTRARAKDTKPASTLMEESNSTMLIGFETSNRNTIATPKPNPKPPLPRLQTDLSVKLFTLPSAPIYNPPTPSTLTKYPTITFAASTQSWLQHRSLKRYQTHLVDFRGMLDHHISGVEDLVQATEDAQMMRYRGQRRDSDALQQLREIERAERIEELRRKGWARERFDAERVRGVCERAEEELGVGGRGR
ncbi:MAG: hypothetical protein MMC23_007460 [Stictis urceolatum]|nr:hypothetical protein [Stictis urceolata]